MANSETETLSGRQIVDFNDTKTAFAHKSNAALRKAGLLFRFINSPWLVNTGSSLVLWLHDKGLNIFNPLIRYTFFEQFCGGTTLEDSQKVVDHLKKKQNSYSPGLWY